MKELISTAVPVFTENIDTDQIIPARFLKMSGREGFGKYLFNDLRFDQKGTPKDFVLDNKLYGGRILIAGKNFGCGSSREHAAWAIKDYGFDVVLSTYFSDIFENNALNNGLLAVKLTEKFVEVMAKQVSLFPKTEIRVNLEKQEVELLDSGKVEVFEIDPFRKHCLLKGLDRVDYLIELRSKIEHFENKRAMLV